MTNPRIAHLMEDLFPAINNLVGSRPSCLP
jgi:hypothetical protein